MPQQSGRQPRPQQNPYAGPSRPPEGETQYRPLENNDPEALRRAAQERKQRLAKARRQQELLQKKRRRNRILLAILALVVIVVGFVVIKRLNGSFGVNTDGMMDELDLTEEELTDEAEDNLYDGPPECTIAFVGDISSSADQVKAATLPDNTFDFESPFADIQEFLSTRSVDYAVGDFESTIVDGLPYGGEPYYNSPIQLAGSLRRLGFRLLSTANTYALNNGIDGVVSTRNNLNASKIRAVGTYLSQEERDQNGGAYIRKIHHINFAFLSYTKGTDSVTMPVGCEYALNTLYTDYADYWSDLRRRQIRADVQAARDAGAEVIVALLHWGSEYSRSVSTAQEELAEMLLENGVDVIIGTHSHLVNRFGFQEVERSDGTKKQCFVAYGLGDFYTDPTDPRSQQSLILNLRFARDEEGEVSITDASYVPIYMQVTENGGRKSFKVLDVYKNMAELRRQDMNSAQALLYNDLLDTIDTLHNYGGADLDVGPAEEDQRIVAKCLSEGPFSDADIRALQKEEEENGLYLSQSLDEEPTPDPDAQEAEGAEEAQPESETNPEDAYSEEEPYEEEPYEEETYEDETYEDETYEETPAEDEYEEG